MSLIDFDIDKNREVVEFIKNGLTTLNGSLDKLSDVVNAKKEMQTLYIPWDNDYIVNINNLITIDVKTRDAFVLEKVIELIINKESLEKIKFNGDFSTLKHVHKNEIQGYVSYIKEKYDKTIYPNMKLKYDSIKDEYTGNEVVPVSYFKNMFLNIDDKEINVPIFSSESTNDSAINVYTVKNSTAINLQNKTLELFCDSFNINSSIEISAENITLDNNNGLSRLYIGSGCKINEANLFNDIVVDSTLPNILVERDLANVKDVFVKEQNILELSDSNLMLTINSVFSVLSSNTVGNKLVLQPDFTQKVNVPEKFEFVLNDSETENIFNLATSGNLQDRIKAFYRFAGYIPEWLIDVVHNVDWFKNDYPASISNIYTAIVLLNNVYGEIIVNDDEFYDLYQHKNSIYECDDFKIELQLDITNGDSDVATIKDVEQLLDL